jgi:ADP-ribosylglycohydrolase
VRDRLLEFAEVPTETPVKDIAARFGSSGWVVETVPLALFVGLKMKQKTLESALTELPEPVEDADTIGSIAGQIAGARLGFARLPESLVSLPFVAAIQHAADGLASFVPEK